MKKKLLTFVFLFWGIFAGSAFASVRLNEIAWMGTSVSGANEWIELYNDAASTVDLAGWRIEAEDGSPNILLTGSILPNGYYLIERTDDTTVPNIPADLVAVFGNGLSNGGETLYIKDASGTIQDTVIGGSSWLNIGGDNTTKQTAQRLLLGNSWITATATPRAVNASSGEVGGASTVSQGNSGTQGTGTASSDISSGTAVASTGGTSKSPVSVYPRKEITVFAGTDQRVFTGFPALFSGHALGLYDEPLRYATYRWNFGDGATAEGSEVTHVYDFSGEYTVILEVSYGSFKNTDRITVVATNPDVVIAHVATGTNGYIELSDRSGREIDLSGWSLTETSAGSVSGKKFFFAPNTILLSGKSVRFPHAVTQLGEMESEIELRTPNGALAYAHGGARPPLPPAGVVTGVMTTTSSRETARTPGISQEVNSSNTFVPAIPRSQKIIQREVIPSATNTAATVLWERGDVSAPGQFSSQTRWFFAFMGLLLIALAGVIIVRSHVDQATIADEYAIIEDIIEGEADLVRKSERIIKE